MRGAAIATVAAAVASLALAPLPGSAQTPLPDGSVAELFVPSLSGNPANPPRFRRPGDTTASVSSLAPPTGRFAAPSRIGRTPIYGSPTGFGAGDTGFDSSNARHKRRKPAPPASLVPLPETTFEPVPVPPPQVPSRPPPVPPPVVYPAKAAARPGAILPPLPGELPITNPPPEVHPRSAAIRHGAVLPVPPPVDAEDAASTPPLGALPLNTVPPTNQSSFTQLLPLGEGDAYAPLGLRAGTFLLFPALELTAAHDSNPQHSYSGGPSYYFVEAPELHVRSDWTRHAFSADILANYTEYATTFTPSLDRPYVNAKIDGRVDVTRDTQILLENRFQLATDNPGSPNITAGVAKLPPNYTVGATLGLAQQFNRFNYSLKGTFDRSIYTQALLTDGTTSSNADRNIDQYAGILRLGYDLTPGLRPFVEIQQDARVHDLQYDRNDEQRNSLGTAVKGGAAVDFFTTITGEAAVGYLERTYADPGLPKISGMTADGSLLWQATPLTSAKLTAASTVTESVLAGVSGELSRDVNLQVDHALRRWLIFTAKGGFGEDDYVGSTRIDHRWFASAALTYKVNQLLSLRTELRQDWLTSSVSGVAFDATSILVGMRLQR